MVVWCTSPTVTPVTTGNVVKIRVHGASPLLEDARPIRSSRISVVVPAIILAGVLPSR